MSDKRPWTREDLEAAVGVPTLRDRFAMAALDAANADERQAAFAQGARYEPNAENVAIRAYWYADAMLKQRGGP